MRRSTAHRARWRRRGRGHGERFSGHVTSSEPRPTTGTPTGWSARLYRHATTSAAAGTVYVVCATGVSATVRGQSFSDSGAALCLAGEIATGGGVAGDSADAVYVARSQPEPTTGAPTGWRAFLRKRPGPVAGTGTVYAVCATGADAVAQLDVRGWFVRGRGHQLPEPARSRAVAAWLPTPPTWVR